MTLRCNLLYGNMPEEADIDRKYISRLSLRLKLNAHRLNVAV